MKKFRIRYIIFANSYAMANTLLGFQINNVADMKFKWCAKIKIDMLGGEFKGRIKTSYYG